ncbi:enoyl-CoA hydratase/isomerase family protein [Microterricola viridarii]|uniref:Enoyl-CoA hydratase n=1 Tax=Microterricola viridarii TaxID=412690 RepID=A0A0Y0NK20_9MICO|nr:enoyl-CoA hydratase/isomerase family protein [Microterricola viridarii]AMB60130.1 enoyl-CoA hydratase [Microterricola viridarii]
MSDSILLTVSDDGLAHVTLNRPDSLNAINAAAAYRWREVAGEIARRGDIRAVLFDAAGRAFCAGGDVVAMAGLGGDGSSAGEGVRELADVIHDGHRLLRESGIPIVAAVQGAVAGGGLGFMLVADVVVASTSARFASKYADIGLTPDCGVSTLLPEAVGTRRALELLLTPRTLSAAEALDWGLVTELAEPDAVADRAMAIAAHWLGGASAAFGQAKRLVLAGQGRSFQESLDDEAVTIGAAFDTPEAGARIAAFTKR